MRRVSFPGLSNFSSRSIWLLTIAMLASTCKSPAKRRGPASDLAGDEQSVISLKDFQYETDDLLLKVLSTKIDCKTASDLVALPANGSFKNTINEIYRSPTPYEYLLENLFNSTRRQGSCHKSAPVSPDAHLLGMRKLINAAKKKNLGITFVMAGGFGSHLTDSGALLDSRQLWQQAFANEIKNGDLRVIRHECTPNSFATDENCAPKIHAKFLELEAGKNKDHRYLFWGYSKGGTSILQALASFPDMRERTLSLITVGSPFGGGLPMIILHPLIESLAKSRAEMSEFNRGLIATMLSFGAGASLGNSASVAQKIVPMYAGSEFETVREGIHSLLPGVRKSFLYDKVKNWDLSRPIADPLTGKSDIPIFHVAAALDVAKLEAIPLMTTDNEDYMVIQQGTQDLSQMGELASIVNFSRFPVSDSCVALEHSVLPKDVVPKGANTSLLGVLALDHMALGFTGPGTAAPATPRPDLPRTALVDAILEAATVRMGL